jgi:hypothetical protein
MRIGATEWMLSERGRGRPRTPAIPGRIYGLGIKVTGELKGLLDSAADISGLTQSQEASARIKLTFDLYGTRLQHLVQLVVDTARSMYPHEDQWLDNRKRYLEVVSAVHKMLLDHAPPPEVSLEEMVAAGRERVALLAATTDPNYAAYLRSLIGTLSRVESFPASVREEFALAATAEPSPITERPPAAPPIAPDWVAAALTHLNSAWQMARVAVLNMTGGGAEPDPLAIAAYLAGNAELRQHGGIPARLRTAEQIWRFREDLMANPPPSGEAETLDSLLAWLAGPPPQSTSEPGPAPIPESEADTDDPGTDGAPTVDPYVQQAIDLGRKLITHLDPEKPRGAAASRKMLETLSRTPGLPSKIAHEFKRAAEPPENEQHNPTTADPGVRTDEGSA